MTDTVDLNSPKVIRKVRASTYGAAIVGTAGAQIAPLLSDPIANLIVALLPFWDSDVGFLAVATLLDLLLIGGFSAAGALGGGYYVRSRIGDLMPKETA